MKGNRSILWHEPTKASRPSRGPTLGQHYRQHRYRMLLYRKLLDSLSALNISTIISSAKRSARPAMTQFPESEADGFVSSLNEVFHYPLDCFIGDCSMS